MKRNTPAQAGQLRRIGVAAAAGAVLALTAGAASAVETTFTGYTNGCFGLACVPVQSNTPSSITYPGSGLTYNNSTFNATTSNGFLGIGSMGQTNPSLNFNNLGSFTLSTAPFEYTGGHFDLRVTFTAPPGILPGNSPIFFDVLTGSVNTAGGGGVFIDFDNTARNFTFSTPDGTGSFSFMVNDVSVTAGDTIGLSGTILSAIVPSIPEPETYALFMAGLAAVGFVARRRKT